MNTTTLTELKSFHFSFQISRKVVFEVNYYRCGNNDHKYFTTSAAQFNQPKTDFNHCGQAQKELLKDGKKAMSFYKKWDDLHLQDLSPEQYESMINDIKVLKSTYNWIQTDNSATFEQLKDLSMMKITTTRPA